MSGFCECGCGQKTPLATNTRHSRGQIKGEPIRFLNGHALRVGRRERFWARVERAAECWLWAGPFDLDGYGRYGSTRAHRIAYELSRGPIPNGLHLDHLCRIRACVNPDHLEPVTQAENNRRASAVRDACKWGHEWTPENTRIDARGTRWCRACARRRAAKYRAQQAEREVS